MRAIDGHVVEFGELAGRLCRGSTVFDWQIVALQSLAAAVGYPFAEIVAADGVPYAPVVAATSVHRYPTLGERVDVDVVPVHAGGSSLGLVYDVADGDGEPVATAHITHVTVEPDGGARPLPDATRETLAGMVVDRQPTVGPELAPDPDDHPTFGSSFPVRSPHVEGVEWGYFAEYPRFAMMVAEEHLAAAGTSLGALTGDDRWFRPRAWSWEFAAPVPYESTLEVGWDVVAAGAAGLLVEHSFRADGRERIAGTTEYGCFDRAGVPRRMPDDLVAPFRG